MLAHDILFKHGRLNEIVRSVGIIPAHPRNARRVLDEGHKLLVFPGGGREVAKHKGERYQLFWKQRLGFARLAIEHGCPIVPFAAVGAEDAFDVVVDADDLMRSPLSASNRQTFSRSMAMPTGVLAATS